MRTEWRGFKGNKWKSEVNVRDFIKTTTLVMTVTRVFLQIQQRLQKNSGVY